MTSKTTEEVRLAYPAQGSLELGAVYNQYGPIMYGLIRTLTDDEELSEKILLHVFEKLQETKPFTRGVGFLPKLMRFTWFTAFTRLEVAGVAPKSQPAPAQTSFVSLFLTRHNSMKEISQVLNLSMEDTMKKLRSEFCLLRGTV